MAEPTWIMLLGGLFLLLLAVGAVVAVIAVAVSRSSELADSSRAARPRRPKKAAGFNPAWLPVIVVPLAVVFFLAVGSTFGHVPDLYRDLLVVLVLGGVVSGGVTLLVMLLWSGRRAAAPARPRSPKAARPNSLLTWGILLAGLAVGVLLVMGWAVILDEIPPWWVCTLAALVVAGLASGSAIVLAMAYRARAEGVPAAALAGPADDSNHYPNVLPVRAPSTARAGPRHCPECQADLPADSPEGLCPRCLLGSALANAEPSPFADRPGGTTPHSAAFAAPTPAELAPHFPHLEILTLIGQGGMGAVYKARQTKLDRLVAIKILPPEWGKDPAFAERFAREARALARLSHPNIVGVHDFGEAGGYYYLIMEFVDGLNLRQLLQTGTLSPEQALAIVPQVCDALQYAHEEEIVHRDIKPENILLDRRGRVKIADFGLAKLLNRPRAEFTLTGSHQVMGTLDYMAPEQRLSPLEIDHRADIYSLGVVFYEMLTGELPLGRFGLPSEKAAVDHRLDEVVLRALEREPERRYQRASEVKADVQAISHGHGPAGGLASGSRVKLDWETAQEQVKGPATGLFLAGLMGPVAWVVAILVSAWAYWDYWDRHPNFFDEALLPMLCCFAFSLLVGSLLVAGSLRMRRLETYELVVIASVVALLPLTNLAFLISLPMGTWALWILCKREVRAAFAHQLRLKAQGPPPRPARRAAPPGPGRRGLMQSVWGLFFTTAAGAPAPAALEGLPAEDRS